MKRKVEITVKFTFEFDEPISDVNALTVFCPTLPILYDNDKKIKDYNVISEEVEGVTDITPEF